MPAPQFVLHTKKCRQIPVETRRDLDPEYLRQAMKTQVEEFPHANFRSISLTYNCMGMVFASRRALITIDEIHGILEDDGYVRVGHTNDVRIGDVIIYGNDKELTHVGIISRIDPLAPVDGDYFEVLSKWGGTGEFFHKSKYVPPGYGSPREFWTDRFRA